MVENVVEMAVDTVVVVVVDKRKEVVDKKKEVVDKKAVDKNLMADTIAVDNLELWVEKAKTNKKDSPLVFVKKLVEY